MTPRVLFVGRTRYRLPLDESLARKWDALGKQMELRVVASGRGHDPRFRLRAPTPLDGPVFYLALPWVVASELRSFRPDVVIAESPYEAAAVVAARRLARSPARLVVEVHGDWRVWSSHYGSRLRNVLGPASKALAGWSVDRADGQRAVSEFTASLVREHGREPLGVFTTYSDLGVFAESPRVPVPPEQKVLFVGVLERYKNLEVLAAAWRLVAARVPEAALRIVGSGTLTAVAERLAFEGVRWDRRLEPREVVAALDESRALVLPSASEGLPRVAVEAFMRGRAVVGTRAGGIPDIVEDGVNGLLVEPGSAAELAAAIERVLTDHELAVRLGEGAARDAARWASSPEEYAERVRAVVDAAMVDSRGSR
jgi:glycosyltransferase involved in cell wall biosynthesis